MLIWRIRCNKMPWTLHPRHSLSTTLKRWVRPWRHSVVWHQVFGNHLLSCFLNCLFVVQDVAAYIKKEFDRRYNPTWWVSHSTQKTKFIGPEGGMHKYSQSKQAQREPRENTIAGRRDKRHTLQDVVFAHRRSHEHLTAWLPYGRTCTSSTSQRNTHYPSFSSL